MKSTIEIIESLHKIILEREPIRMELIKSFQNKVWEDESIKDETLNEILSGLAYDLDFYEPNEDWRNEDPSYYGDDRLEKEIRIAIQKLQALNPE
ncbi:hypothetical protein [Gynurincola endophyticus]|uniref:hypothetical protein n=1 Tax=Gynurincola endophyticus TaxID=2479004 RepID=UPI000F8D68C9|nr:hypothetical protein [Gynurincola endophyticus]